MSQLPDQPERVPSAAVNTSADTNPESTFPGTAERAPASISAPAPVGFGNIAPRPVGFRYGDGDLVPGGDLRAGGMMMGPPAFNQFPPPTADDFARHDPMFPGHNRNFRVGGQPRAFLPVPAFPGEPDPDHLLPLQGGPNDPFGGPGGGQFGPRMGPRQSPWGPGGAGGPGGFA